MKAFLRAGKHLLVVVLFVASWAMTGCAEANWTLANESRLPKGIELPPGLTRKDVSVDMNTYVTLRGPDVKFMVRDSKGKKLEVVKGNSLKTVAKERERLVILTSTNSVVIEFDHWGQVFQARDPVRLRHCSEVVAQTGVGGSAVKRGQPVIGIAPHDGVQVEAVGLVVAVQEAAGEEVTEVGVK